MADVFPCRLEKTFGVLDTNALDNKLVASMLQPKADRPADALEGLGLGLGPAHADDGSQADSQADSQARGRTSEGRRSLSKSTGSLDLAKINPYARGGRYTQLPIHSLTQDKLAATLLEKKVSADLDM